MTLTRKQLRSDVDRCSNQRPRHHGFWFTESVVCYLRLVLRIKLKLQCYYKLVIYIYIYFEVSINKGDSTLTNKFGYSPNTDILIILQHIALIPLHISWYQHNLTAHRSKMTIIKHRHTKHNTSMQQFTYQNVLKFKVPVD